MITAILKMSGFERKLKTPAAVPMLQVPLIIPIRLKHEEYSSVQTVPNDRVLVFELKRQVGKRSFEYWFKEII